MTRKHSRVYKPDLQHMCESVDLYTNINTAHAQLSSLRTLAHGVVCSA